MNEILKQTEIDLEMELDLEGFLEVIYPDGMPEEGYPAEVIAEIEYYIEMRGQSDSEDQQ